MMKSLQLRLTVQEEKKKRKKKRVAQFAAMESPASWGG